MGCTLSKVLHQQELESEFDSKDVEQVCEVHGNFSVSCSEIVI